MLQILSKCTHLIWLTGVVVVVVQFFTYTFVCASNVVAGLRHAQIIRAKNKYTILIPFCILRDAKISFVVIVVVLTVVSTDEPCLWTVAPPCEQFFITHAHACTPERRPINYSVVKSHPSRHTLFDGMPIQCPNI